MERSPDWVCCNRWRKKTKSSFCLQSAAGEGGIISFTVKQPPLATRRQFLKQGVGLTFCVVLGPRAVFRSASATGGAPPPGGQGSRFNAYVNIAADGTITIYYPSAEMGQGVMTALPLIVAEELDADWNDVRVEPSPPIGEVYGDPVFINMIYTVASRAVPTYWDRLRTFGAQARKVLLQNAAREWHVPTEELRTEPSRVVHEKTGRILSYGQIAALGRIPETLPPVDPSELKDPSQFRLIGTDVEPAGLIAKVTGATQYSIDVTLPDLVHAVISRPPVMGATLQSVDETEARSLPGVIGIYRRERQVAVVARSFYEAQTARGKLRVDWDPAGKADDYDSDLAVEENSRVARDLTRPGIPWDAQGSVAERFNSADLVFDREYRSDFMYHASMEPLNAVVWVKDGGESVEAWVGTQAPAYTVNTLAQATGVEPSRVTLHRSLLGGAFGRRSVYGMDFVEDAAWLSKELQRPVKVIWTREDDIRNGYFRPMTAQYLRAALGKDGRILAWHHRVACEDPIRRHEPLLDEAWQQAPLIGMHGSEHQGTDGTPLDFAYDLPQRLVEYLAVEAGVRVYAMRGVGSLANRFAVESFLDELAQHFHVDPLDYRLGLLHRSERAQQLLHTVADMASWGKPRPGRALGLSYAHHADSLLACVAEISLESKGENIVVHNVWVAADVGIAVQPDNVRAQVEGGVVFGLSNAMTERISVKEGLVQQSNFHDYTITRMRETPRIHVQVMPSRVRPTGVGETGTVVTPAALANAFAALTGKRIRHLPMTSERLLEALA